MTQRIVAAVLLMAIVPLIGGCAGNESALTTSSSTVATQTEKTSPAAGEPAKPASVTNAIAALVNDEVITLHEVIRESQTALSEAGKKGSVSDGVKNQIRRTALDRLIEKKLTEQKIRELNIRVPDEEIRQAIDDVRKQNKIPNQEAFLAALSSQGLTFEQYRAQLQEQIEKLRLISMEVRAKVLVGESEMRSYYAANIAKYSEDESYRARHIFFKSGAASSPSERATTRTTALAVLADAKGGKDFIELAKAFSEDPAARKDGGDLGSFKKGDMQPELEKTILSLKPGEVSDLVSTTIGLHIIKLEAIQPGVVKPFESVKGEIEEILYRKKSEERFNQWAKELRSKATIEIKKLDGLL